MSGLSTHVLDTSSGRPAANMRVRLCDQNGEISSAITDAEGRCASLLPQGVPLRVGTYRLIFETGLYFENGFYPEVCISFVVRDASSHYHVPLLISPFGFTTYRGS
jgi:5-hydroxyisourate hydrolase